MTTRQLFVNLAVEDLDRSIAFFTALGFTFDANMTDEKATCMDVGTDAKVMLLTTPFFAGFTKKTVADAAAQTEAILCVSAVSRDEVDDLFDKALASGGKPSNDTMDDGPMYCKSFQDPDGHLWEVMYMDLSAFGG